MNIAKVEENILNLIKTFTEETFIYDLLLAYGKPRASISLHIPIQTGQRFQSKPGSDSNPNRAVIPIQTEQ